MENSYLYIKRKSSKIFQNNNSKIINITFFGIGILLGSIFFKFSLPIQLVVPFGLAFLFISVWKIEIPLFFYILSIVILDESYEYAEGNIFALTDPNFSGIPSITEMLFTILLLSYLVKVTLFKLKSSFSITKLYFISFLLLFGISTFIGLHNGNDPILFKEDFKHFLFPILFFTICMDVLATEYKINKVFWIIFIFAAIKALIGIITFIMGYGFKYGESQIIFYDTGDHLIFTTIVLISICKIIIQKYSFSQISGTALCLLPMLLSIFLSDRRHIFLGFMSSILFSIYLIRGYKRIKAISIIGLLLIIVIFVVLASSPIENLPSPSYIVDRISSVKDTEQSSNKFRILEWQLGFEAIMSSPIFGLGFGSVHKPVPGSEIGKTITVIIHNGFLLLWIKMGFIALILFCVIIVRFFLTGLKMIKINQLFSNRALVIGIFGSMPHWFIAFSVFPFWSYYRQPIFIALMMALALKQINLATYKSDPKYSLDK